MYLVSFMYSWFCWALYSAFCITQRIQHKFEYTVKQTWKDTHMHTPFYTKIMNLPKACKAYAKYLIVQSFDFYTIVQFLSNTSAKTIAEEDHAYEKKKDALSDSRFGVVELSLTSRGRAGTQQKKQTERGRGNSCQGSMSVFIPQECTSEMYMTIITTTDMEEDEPRSS